MEFELEKYQQIRMELQRQQMKADAGQPVDTQEMLSGMQNLLDMFETIRFRDAQLGIYNHSYWMHQMEVYIAEEDMGLYNACYFNLKRFVLINHAYGRDTGTEIMGRFVQQLQEMLAEKEFVCRIGGDSFAVFYRKEHQQMIMDYLQGAAISIDGTEENKVHIEAYAGFYVIDKDEVFTEPSQILDRCSEALNVARNVRKVPYMFWDEDMMAKQENRKTIEGIFHECLEKEEFVVYYQPKVDLRDYSLTGAEALCRWIHEGSVVPPNDFIPILEQSRDICDLDFYMLDRVCRDIHKWREEGREAVKVSVNLSRRHMEDMHLLERLFAIIDRYEVPHQLIEIELTETTTDVEFKDLRRIVNGLQIQDISTSVDDFGVGYSSLNLIRELPWNVLKIDKSFLPTAHGMDDKKDMLFRQLVSLAQSLGLECIVEGVETAEQVRILKKNNCFLAQGYFFDKPLPVAEFEQRLDAKIHVMI